jgi:O-acetyl-ADP-ribose deacetylase (regulator of RNase III)
MQRELHAWLAARGRRFVERGEVVVTGAHGVPVRAVVHAVAVNGFYETSAEIVGDVVEAALRAAAELGARRVALAAVGTGYGRLSMREFARGIRRRMSINIPPIEDVAVCVRNAGDRADLTNLLAEE